MCERLSFIGAISPWNQSLLSLPTSVGSGRFELIVWISFLFVSFVTWVMLWLVGMSQPLGQFGLRLLKLHLRMLTVFAGGHVS